MAKFPIGAKQKVDGLGQTPGSEEKVGQKLRFTSEVHSGDGREYPECYAREVDTSHDKSKISYLPYQAVINPRKPVKEGST